MLCITWYVLCDLRHVLCHVLCYAVLHNMVCNVRIDQHYISEVVGWDGAGRNGMEQHGTERNKPVCARKTRQSRPMRYMWLLETMLLFQMREIVHDNLCVFIGLCVDPGNICILTKFCLRGSLQVSFIRALVLITQQQWKCLQCLLSNTKYGAEVFADTVYPDCSVNIKMGVRPCWWPWTVRRVFHER